MIKFSQKSIPASNRKGRPATGQGKSVYIPDHLLGIVDRLKAEDWEGAVKEILDLCPFQ